MLYTSKNQMTSYNLLLLKRGSITSFVLSDHNQLDDIAQFCCFIKYAALLRVGMVFNLSNLWATDAGNSVWLTGDNPVFLGPPFLDPALLHFTKNGSTFSRLAPEMLAIKPEIVSQSEEN